jgi:hypothetical protein
MFAQQFRLPLQTSFQPSRGFGKVVFELGVLFLPAGEGGLQDG